MKNIKFLWIAASCFTFLAIIFYGCKKYDSSISDTQIKDYAYFKSMMSTDENLNRMFTEVKKTVWLLSYNTYSKLKLATTKQVKTRGDIKIAAEKLKVQAKNIKTESQLIQFQTTLGFGRDSKEIVNAISKQRDYFLQFVKLNPDFKLLTQQQQIELLTQALTTIEQNSKKLFSDVQEKTYDDCIADYDNNHALIANTWYTGLIIINIQLVLCIGGTEGILTPACLEVWTVEAAGLEILFWAAEYELIYQLNECVDGAPDKPISV